MSFRVCCLVLVSSLLTSKSSRTAPQTGLHTQTPLQRHEMGEQWVHRLALLHKMRQTADDVNFSLAFSASEKGGQWKKSWALTDMPADEISFSLLISAGDKGRLGDQALALLHKMRAASMIISFNSNYGGQWEPASACDTSMLVNKIRLSAAISTQWDQALTLFDKTRSHGEQWKQSLALLHKDMRDHGRTADEISFSSAITSCEKGGQWVMMATSIRLSQRARRDGSGINHGRSMRHPVKSASARLSLQARRDALESRHWRCFTRCAQLA